MASKAQWKFRETVIYSFHTYTDLLLHGVVSTFKNAWKHKVIRNKALTMFKDHSVSCLSRGRTLYIVLLLVDLDGVK